MRQGSQCVPQVQDLPDLSEKTCQRGYDSRHEKSQLVTEVYEMSLSDPIADMLTRIRNALRSRHATVNAPASNICEGICSVLKEEGYINDCDKIDDGNQGHLRIHLKYGALGEDVITTIRRVSRPGCRIYRGVDDIPRPLGGMGISIVSTSEGILSDRQCRSKKVGGEVLCVVE